MKGQNEKNWRQFKRSSEALNDQQIKKLKAAAKAHSFRAEMIINILIDTGMRVTDLVNLRFGNIDFKRKRINYKQKKTKKKVSSRIRTETTELLKKWREVNNSQFLFPSKDKRRKEKTITRTTVFNLISNLAKNAGIDRKVSPHDLCSTAISLAGWRKLPIKFSEIQYGRTSRTITRHYQKMPPEKQDELFNEAFDKKK